MNPHERLPASPASLLRSLWLHRRLIMQMTRREVIGRYNGSIIGLAWSFFNPLLMLLVYTFVFGVVFKARWGTDGDTSRTKFALVLFTGLIVHSLLSECLVRAPELVVSQVNYVKKVVFPLEILPVVVAFSAVFHALVSALALLIAMAFVNSAVPWTAPMLPIVLAPLVVGALGITWMLAAVGVFVRDIAQTMGLITTILMFVSPIFFPVSALPASFQHWVALNPLTFFIEQARNVVLWGVAPDWAGLALRSVFACVVAWAGYWWFQRTRKGFGDVL
jgi:lipopolysaccharide transport system permease protein